MVTTVDDDTIRASLERQLERMTAKDSVASHEIYLDDAVVEFPQSGERFEGIDNFRPWRAQYPADVEYHVRGLTGSGSLWVRELSVRYDGGPWMLGVAILEMRGDRIARERIYVTEPWSAPAWRAPWRSQTTAA